MVFEINQMSRTAASHRSSITCPGVGSGSSMSAPRAAGGPRRHANPGMPRAGM